MIEEVKKPKRFGQIPSKPQSDFYHLLTTPLSNHYFISLPTQSLQYNPAMNSGPEKTAPLAFCLSLIWFGTEDQTQGHSTTYLFQFWKRVSLSGYVAQAGLELAFLEAQPPRMLGLQATCHHRSESTSTRVTRWLQPYLEVVAFVAVFFSVIVFLWRETGFA